MTEMKSDTPALLVDHVVIAVAGLQKAVEEYQHSGFSVELGGVNGPTENALILFADGTYIELIALRFTVTKFLVKCLDGIGLLGFMLKRKPSLRIRCLMWFAGKGGLVDWCVSTTNMEQSIDCLELQGISMGVGGQFNRTRPDGVIAKWLLASSYQRNHPFLIQDVTDRRLRAPFSDSLTHANGAIGIKEITVNGQDFQNMTANASYFFTGGNHLAASKHKAVKAQSDYMTLVLEGPAKKSKLLAIPGVTITLR